MQPYESSEKDKPPIFPERISRQELLQLPRLTFQGNIHVITNKKQLTEALKTLSDEPFLGFDTETRPSFRRGESYPVSLLQLSSESDAFLFRLKDVGLPFLLKELFEHSTIQKIGLAIHDDIKALQKKENFEPKGFIDLADIARRLGIVTTGLRNLVGIFLRSRLSKRSQLSNWECKTLDENQRIYAATDAWVCREIFQKINEAGLLNFSEEF